MISQCNHKDGQAWVRLDLVLSPNLAQCATVHIFLREEERNNRFRRLHYFTGCSATPPQDTFAAFLFPPLDTFAYRHRPTSNDCPSLHVQPRRIGHAGPAVAPLSCPPPPLPASLSPATGDRASCQVRPMSAMPRKATAGGQGDARREERTLALHKRSARTGSRLLMTLCEAVHVSRPGLLLPSRPHR
jgi:hypothetical protein